MVYKEFNTDVWTQGNLIQIHFLSFMSAINKFHDINKSAKYVS